MVAGIHMCLVVLTLAYTDHTEFTWLIAYQHEEEHFQVGESTNMNEDDTFIELHAQNILPQVLDTEPCMLRAECVRCKEHSTLDPNLYPAAIHYSLPNQSVSQALHLNLINLLVQHKHVSITHKLQHTWPSMRRAHSLIPINRSHT